MITYKDIRHKYGTIFSFKNDIRKEVNIIYMIIDPRAHLSCLSAIVNMKDGGISEFEEYDSINKEEVILAADFRAFTKL